MNPLIAEARRLNEEATPGPWGAEDTGMYCGHACTPNGCHENHPSGESSLDGPLLEVNGWCVDDNNNDRVFLTQDANLIARYRTLAPELADALEKAEAEVVRLRAVLTEVAEPKP